MSTPIVQAQYEQLEQIAARFAAAAEQQQALQERVNRQVEVLRSGGWQGRGVAAFLSEMDGEVRPAQQRLTVALNSASRSTLLMLQTVKQAEENASLIFRQRLSGNNLVKGGKSSSADLLDYTETGLSMLPLLLLPFMRPGGNYPGQIIFKAPTWMKSLGISGRWIKGLAGASPNLTHIKAANLWGHVGRFSKGYAVIGGMIAITKGALAVNSEWTSREKEYSQYSSSRLSAARTVDGALAAAPSTGGFVGGLGGAAAGALIGSLIAPGPGTIIGGVVGSIAFGMLGENLAETGVKSAREAGWRDPAIDMVEKYVTAPLHQSIDSIWQKTQQRMGQPNLSQVSFSFK
ncbi:MAG TPA: hypothetical protein DCL15_23320 [Chloroflexi bacterium]|nr:hypothetical protein [Chloroflexota bacterium]HHW86549.1 WXG100 family type VII secretion target [Chloroflexota bacterium]